MINSKERYSEGFGRRKPQQEHDLKVKSQIMGKDEDEWARTATEFNRKQPLIPLVRTRMTLLQLLTTKHPSKPEIASEFDLAMALWLSQLSNFVSRVLLTPTKMGYRQHLRMMEEGFLFHSIYFAIVMLLDIVIEWEDSGRKSRAGIVLLLQLQWQEGCRCLVQFER